MIAVLTTGELSSCQMNVTKVAKLATGCCSPLTRRTSLLFKERNGLATQLPSPRIIPNFGLLFCKVAGKNERE